MAKREANPPVVIRMSGPLLSAIDDDAEKADMSRSEWLRTVAETAITWNWMARNRPVLLRSEANIRMNGERRLGMNVYMPSGDCLHPPTAWEESVASVTCGLCGQVVRRRM